MKFLEVKIVELVDADFPGWVKCVFRDIDNIEWHIVEKAPVVSLENFNSETVLPKDGQVGCEIIGEFVDRNNKRILRIDTSRPWGIEEEGGQTVFDVFEYQIKEEP